LNALGDNGSDVFLTSRDDPSTKPSWLHGNIPSSTGESDSPVPVIFVKKIVKDDSGTNVEVTDMFSFYFFSFNAGPRLPNEPTQFFGDHVGDLEHSVVRFEAGKPKTVYLSRHGSGTLYPFASLQKHGSRVSENLHTNFAYYV